MSSHPLRQWRIRNGVTLSNFAQMIGSTASSISRVERGNQSPSLSLMMRIVAATDSEVSVMDFFLDWQKNDHQA